MHVDVDVNQESTAVLADASHTSHETIRDMLHVPYQFVFAKIKKPPRNEIVESFSCGWVWNMIVIWLTVVGLYRIMLIRWFPSRAWRLIDVLQPPIRLSKRARKKKHCLQMRTALTTAAPFKGFQSFLFNSDGMTFVVDNAANCHVCKDKSLFVGDIKDSHVSLDTANGVNGPRLQVGSIKISWLDDNGYSYVYQLDAVIYNPKSPFNILSVGRLGSHFGKEHSDCDDDGTYIRSSANFSTFTWDHRKFTWTFAHSSDGLPELLVNVGMTGYNAFCSRVCKLYDDSISYAFATTVIEYEQDELDLPSDDNSFSGDFKKDKDVYYRKGNGTNCPACYLHSFDKNGGQLHEIRLENGDIIETDASHITHLEQPDVTNIPTDLPTYCQEGKKGLTTKDIAAIANPQTLSPLQQEFLARHHRLYHMPFHRMIQLAQEGHLPCRFLKLQNNTPICVSCKFGQAHKRPWQTLGKQSNPIRSKEHNLPGDCVSTDQMVSAQPGLVPQMSGFLMSERIWGITLFVDHATDWTYGHLMRSLKLSETLLAKLAFEKIAARSGHSICRYHADNGQ